MRLRIPIPTLMAGLVAGCATAATLLPVTPALAEPGRTTPRPAAASSPAVPKPAGAAVAVAESERFAPPSAPLPPALLGQAVMGEPAGTTVAPFPERSAFAAVGDASAAASCTPADFAGRSGADLVAFVESSTTDCVSTLFDGVNATNAGGVFKQSQMLPVAAAFRNKAATYTGDNTNSIHQLVLFLRAGYYAQSNFSGTVGSYDATLTNAVKSGIDGFFAGARSNDVSDNNGGILKEVLILTDSTNLQGSYLGVYKRYLDAYDNSYNASPKMVGAVNSVLKYPLWRGNWNPGFVRAVTADTAIVTALGNFAVAHRDLLTGPNAALDVNAGNDLGRIAGQNATIEAVAKPLVKQVLDSVQITGPGGQLYVKTAYQATTFNGVNCSYYGTCNLPAKLTAAVLPNQLVCDNRTLQTQALSAAELAAVCASLRGQDPFFHALVKDNGPIPNQYNKTVTFGIFANKADYATYSWAIYGNSTDNGGQTVMDPTDPNNQAVTVMYQKSWNNNDTARVWNLNHEYTHYLDAIYDMKGNFSTQTSVPDIWWVEGIAEYVSHTYRGVTATDAMAQAGRHTYKLSTIFQNTYGNADSTRIYAWGYLAVRYMVEKHPGDVQAMLARFRTGDYQGGYAVYNGLGTSYDADFDSWLTSCAAGSCYAAGPTALFDQSVNGATVTVTDRSVQTGPGQITSWNWTFGDGSSSTLRNPSHTYQTAGTYTVALTVTDSTGRFATSPASVTVTTGGGPVTLPACTQARNDELGRNCSRPNRAATAGNTDYMYVHLPAGTTTLKVTTSGGSGNAHLYYNPTTWASPTAFTSSSTDPGSTQTITVTNPTAGYRYISLHADTTFTGVTISTQF